MHYLSVQHSMELLDWVAESGRNFTNIYVTHARGDHFFGLKPFLNRPNRKVVRHRFCCFGYAKQISRTS